MTALDKIRLTGLLRKSPAPAGLFYARARMGSLRHMRRRHRRQRAWLWRRFAGEAVDFLLQVGLYFGYRIARRMAADDADPHEAATTLPGRVRAVIAQEFKSARQGDEPPTAFTWSTFLQRTGGPGWTAKRAVSLMVAGLVESGPLILTGGQTPGRMLVGVRVESLDGRPMSVRQALVRGCGWRAVVASSDLLPLPATARGGVKITLLWFGPAVWFVDQRSLVDKLAGTRVVRAW